MTAHLPAYLSLHKGGGQGYLLHPPTPRDSTARFGRVEAVERLISGKSSENSSSGENFPHPTLDSEAAAAVTAIWGEEGRKRTWMDRSETTTMPNGAAAAVCVVTPSGARFKVSNLTRPGRLFGQ